MPSVDIAFEKNIDSSTILYRKLVNHPFLNVVDPAKKNVEEELRKGRIAAVVDIHQSDSAAIPYTIHLRTSSASQREYMQLQPVLSNVIHTLDTIIYQDRRTIASISKTEVPGREYKMIDFFLPGMIGFSLIGSAVFGIAFLFYSLRDTLVLKRMYATPVRRTYILLGESISKVLFQLLTVVVLIVFGYLMYDFTLAHGIITFFNMLLLSFLGLLVFMGFGFLISGISKNQNVIPIYANLFMFPQYFLSGTFFPKTALPASMQPFIKFLPLTALNDALRNVAFEGTSLVACWPQILILSVWGILIYAFTARLFRWE